LTKIHILKSYFVACILSQIEPHLIDFSHNLKYNSYIVKRNRDHKVIRALSMLSQFTLFLLVPILGLGALGWLLDRQFGTKWIAILFFFIGAVAGFQNIYRYAMSISEGRGSADSKDESSDSSEK